MDAAFHLRWLLRRWVWFAAAVAVSACFGIGLNRYWPETYRAEARLLVDMGTPQDAARVAPVGAADHFQTLQSRALTRDSLTALAERLGLHPDGTNTDATIHDLRARIGMAVIPPAAPATRGPAAPVTVIVSFSAPDGSQAAAGSNAVAAMLVQQDRAMQQAAADEKADALRQDADRLDRALERTSGAILAFRRDHRDALPDSLEFRQKQHLAAQDQLARLEQEHTALRDARDRLLRVSRAARLANGPQPMILPLSPPIAPNAFTAELARTDTRISMVESRIASLRASLQELDRSIRQTPENALALARLQQDHAAMQDQHSQAMARKALAEPVNGATVESRIRMIEPASAPHRAERPDYALIRNASLAGGVASGFALLALLALMRRSIDRPADLTRALGITPFAALPHLPSPAELWRGRAALAAVTLIGMGGLAAAFWTEQRLPIDGVIAQILPQPD